MCRCSLLPLLQDRVLRSGVNVEPNSDAVAYWNIILGTFMASFDLRAFPFDGQRLHVQMEVPGWAGGNVRLKPSSGGTRMFNTNPGKGFDDDYQLQLPQPAGQELARLFSHGRRFDCCGCHSPVPGRHVQCWRVATKKQRDTRGSQQVCCCVGCCAHEQHPRLVCCPALLCASPCALPLSYQTEMR